MKQAKYHSPSKKKERDVNKNAVSQLKIDLHTFPLIIYSSNPLRKSIADNWYILYKQGIQYISIHYTYM